MSVKPASFSEKNELEPSFRSFLPLTEISRVRINCISYQLLRKEHEKRPFYHLMKNCLFFGQNFIGLQSSRGPLPSLPSLTCHTGKSSRHLLIIFSPAPFISLHVLPLSGPVMEQRLYLVRVWSVRVINNSNKNQNKDLPSRLCREIEAFLIFSMEKKNLI